MRIYVFVQGGVVEVAYAADPGESPPEIYLLDRDVVGDDLPVIRYLGTDYALMVVGDRIHDFGLYSLIKEALAEWH